MKGPCFTRGPSKDFKVLNGALQMTQNLAEPVGRLCSRTDRFPWSFPSLDLDRSHTQLATAWSPVEILYASSGDRLCLFRPETGGAVTDPP